MSGFRPRPMSLRQKIMAITLAVMALLFVFAVCFTLHLARLSDEADARRSQSALSDAVNTLQSHMNEVVMAENTLRSDSDILSYITLRDRGNTNAVIARQQALREKLKLMLSVNQSIASVSLAFPDFDAIISYEGVGSLDAFLEQYDLPSDCMSAADSAFSHVINATDETGRFSGKSDTEMQFHIYAVNSRCLVVVCVSQAWINNQLARQFSGKDMSVYVTTESGQLYGCYEPGDERLSVGALNEAWTERPGKLTVGGERCDALYAEVNSLRLTALFRRSAVNETFAQGRLLLTAICLGFIALSVTLYVVMNRWFYRPVSELLLNCAPESDSEDENEYARISSVMDSMRASITSLEQRMRDNAMQAQERTRSMMRAVFVDGGASEPSDARYYVAFSLVIEDANGIFQDSRCRKMCLLMQDRFDLTVLYDHSDAFAGVISLPAAALPDDALRDMLAGLLSEGDFARMGLSTVYSDRRFLPAAYEESRDALESNAAQLLSVYDPESFGRAPRRFTVTLTQQTELASRLLGGDRGAIERTLDGIYSANEQLNQYWQCRLSCYLLDLMIVLESPLGGKLVIDANEKWVTSRNPQFLKKQVYSYYGRLCETLCPKEEDIGEQVKKYIDAHLGDPNLTLNDAADHVNRAYTYVSACFSRSAGMSFSAYLQKRRVAVAMRLLAETTEPIAQVAARVGYDVPGSFIRLFKKETGMTPGQYREFAKHGERER